MSGKRKEQFFWDEGLPFVELRRSQASSRSFRLHMVLFCRDLFECSCQPFQQESPVPEGAEVSMLRKLLGEDLDQELTLNSLADRLGFIICCHHDLRHHAGTVSC